MSFGNYSIRCVHISCRSLLPRGRFPYFNWHKPVTDPELLEHEYFERQAAKLPIDKAYITNLSKLYWEKKGAARDVRYKQEDSLVEHDSKCWLPELDTTQPKRAYKNLDSLRSAPESVKKIFSVEFGQRADKTEAWKEAVLDQVRQHPLDMQSIEAKVGRSTAYIRQWSLLFEEIAKKTGTRPGWLTGRIHNMLGYRRRLLRELRDRDVKKFERVLQELKIAYRVPPLPEDVVADTRKLWSEEQVRRRVAKEKEQLLEQFHQRLLAKRQKFEAQKKKRLEELDKEEAEISKKLNELTTLDGEVLDVKGTYQGSPISCLSEDKMHQKFFYHDFKK